jgi:hypothetical protein
MPFNQATKAQAQTTHNASKTSMLAAKSLKRVRTWLLPQWT